MAKTFYEILDVSNSASPATIKAAFDAHANTLSAKMQAGDNDAANRLKFVRTAYEALSNPQQRSLYDQRLASIQARTAPAPTPRVSQSAKVPAAPEYHSSKPEASPGGFGRWGIAIIMGFFSGLLIYFLAAFVLLGGASAPSSAFVFGTFFGGWAISAYVMQKGARTLSKVFARGFLMGAAEWLLVIPAGMLFAGKVVATTASATGTSAGAAGAAIGGGIFAFLTGGLAIAMALACLVGFAVAHFMGREMAPEKSPPTKKCPECAELVQQEARKCRYCGATL